MSDIDGMNVGLRWYIAHTYAGYENKVKANLEKIVENRGLGNLIYDIPPTWYRRSARCSCSEV